MASTFPRWSVWSLLALLAATPALAQSTASLRGAVTDEQGAALPGAKILVRNQATGEERAAQTDAAGEYQVAALPARPLPARGARRRVPGRGGDRPPPAGRPGRGPERASSPSAASPRR